jgi:hypothetical protein
MWRVMVDRLVCILSIFRKERWLTKESNGALEEVFLEREEGAGKDLQNNKTFPNINGECLGATQQPSR